jgi:hypothetical protein
MVGPARRAKSPWPIQQRRRRRHDIDGEERSAGSVKRYRVPRLTATAPAAPPADGTLGDDMRRIVGVGVLALSVLYSAIDLLGWLRPCC